MHPEIIQVNPKKAKITAPEIIIFLDIHVELPLFLPQHIYWSCALFFISNTNPITKWKITPANKPAALQIELKDCIP
jgi:hypothetical protein